MDLIAYWGGVAERVDEIADLVLETSDDEIIAAFKKLLYSTARDNPWLRSKIIALLRTKFNEDPFDHE